MSEKQLIYLIAVTSLLIYMYFKQNNNVLKNKSKFNISNNFYKHDIKSSSSLIVLPKEKFTEFSEQKTEIQPQNNCNNDLSFPTALDYYRSYGELISLGCKPTTSGQKNAIRISKGLDGRWFYCKKSGFNSQKDRLYLSLNRMPNLQTLLLKIELSDPLLKLQGGRVLMTQNGHFRRNIYSYQPDPIVIS